MTSSAIKHSMCRSFLIVNPRASGASSTPPEKYQLRKFQDKHHALTFLSRLRLSESYLQRLYHRHGGHLYRGARKGEILNWVANALVSGKLKFYEQRITKNLGSASASPAKSTATYAKFETVKDEPKEAVTAEVEAPIQFDEPVEEQEEEKNWVEFMLLDDDTGEPIANVPLKLKLPDGSSIEVTSDSNGCVRCDDIPEGNCEIEEILDEEAFEVSALESA